MGQEAAGTEEDDLKLAQRLTLESETDARARWDALSDNALLDEIAAYKRALKSVAAVTGRQIPHAGGLKGGEGVGPGGDRVKYYEVPVDKVDPVEWEVPEHCVPIRADVTSYDWGPLCDAVQFDVIMMDPPWLLATNNPTRGVSLGYGQLTSKDIQNLPIRRLQGDGLLLMWVINSSYGFAMELFDRWGYEVVDEVVWVKQTVNRRLAKSHGFYLQHAKEVCLVGMRGKGPKNLVPGAGSDIILSQRRGQSQKPVEIYELVEALVPGGTYLEIFARKNNLRDYWVSVGNELCEPKGEKGSGVLAVRA